MSILSFFYNLIIAPIELIIEFVFVFAKEKICAGGGIFASIVTVSLAVNFLALPLYNIADNLQKKERDIQRKMAKWLSHIKKTFSGDERFMMIQEYYRQTGYHPLYALRSSLSILIEIPFFIAAYHFLSASPSLKGASFAIFSDLGSPDKLISFSLFGKEFFINVLPILMTLINIFSGIVYLKDAPIREKIQVYGLAAIFLVILYNSPSGLVLYWILNNLFSLLKNIVNEKFKNPGRVVSYSIAVILLVASVGVLGNQILGFKKRLIFFAFAVFVAAVIFSYGFLRKFFRFIFDFFRKICSKNLPQKQNVSGCDFAAGKYFSILLFSALGLSVLHGFLLPSEVIAASPVEFSFIDDRTNPLSFIFGSFSFSLGLFTFWPILIFELFSEKVKKSLSYLWSFLFIAAVLNAYIFRQHFGTMNIFSVLDNTAALEKYTLFYTAAPIFAFAAVIALLFAVSKFRFQKYLSIFLVVLLSSEVIFASVNSFKINKEYKNLVENLSNQKNQVSQDESKNLSKIYNFSKTQKNVVVLFLDRAIPTLFPYIFKEFPELNEVFSGFTLFPNSVSYSSSTIKASPALMGGYEYTPENINKRPDELLKDKHNEATLVMPKLFSDAGYDVSVANLPLPNYSWHGDLSAYKKVPEVKVYETGKKYSSLYLKEHPEIKPEKESFCVEGNLCSFSLMEMLPPVLRQVFYFSGCYFRELIPHYLNNVPSKFLDEWASLYYLPEISDFTNEKPAFIFIDNETTHEPCVLEERTYLPKKNLEKSLATCGNGILEPETDAPVEYYHITATTLLRLAEWMKILKENGVYDNTRIIFVGDHGASMNLPAFKGMEFADEYSQYNTLLMFKDFGASGKFRISDSFMTNADTLILATDGLPVSSENPFTHKKFRDFIQKDEVMIYPCLDINTFREFDSFYLMDKTQFVLEDEKYHTPYYKVHSDIFNEKNWTRLIK